MCTSFWWCVYYLKPYSKVCEVCCWTGLQIFKGQKIYIEYFFIRFHPFLYVLDRFPLFFYVFIHFYKFSYVFVRFLRFSYTFIRFYMFSSNFLRFFCPLLLICFYTFSSNFIRFHMWRKKFRFFFSHVTKKQF